MVFWIDRLLFSGSFGPFTNWTYVVDQVVKNNVIILNFLSGELSYVGINLVTRFHFGHKYIFLGQRFLLSLGYVLILLTLLLALITWLYYSIINSWNFIVYFNNIFDQKCDIVRPLTSVRLDLIIFFIFVERILLALILLNDNFMSIYICS